MSDKTLVWLLFEQDGAVLFALRKPDRPPFAGQLTLPGGEAESGESHLEAVGRIGREEVGVEIMGAELQKNLTAREGDEAYDIAVYSVGYEGTPRFRESGPFLDVRWGRRSEIADPALPVPGVLRSYLTSEGGAT